MVYSKYTHAIKFLNSMFKFIIYITFTAPMKQCFPLSISIPLVKSFDALKTALHAISIET